MNKSPTSHRFISQRLQLHYVDWGNPDAPPLLLLHGGQDHCRNWDWVAEKLSHDWHVIAPDLCGHGDSSWSPQGEYSTISYVYDLAQLIHQLKLTPVNIIAHSLGGAIALRYTGLYPNNVRKIIAIEGLGPSPQKLAEIEAKSMPLRLQEWIEEKRAAAARSPRRYASIKEAYTRMKTMNSFLSDEQAYHLTVQGVSQNEDGSYSWKFDNYVRFMAPTGIPQKEIEALWGAITCPTLLLYGAESWASNPVEDGRIKHFKNAEVKVYENAGHWLHHDQTERFIEDVIHFL